MGTLRRGMGLLAWLAVLVSVLVAFTALGDGTLAAPPVTAPSAWGAWAAQRAPLEATFAILRLVVLAVAWYLLGVSLIGVAARLLRWGRLTTVADIVTVPAVRRLLQAALGLGLATAAVTAVTVPGREYRGPTAVAAVEQAEMPGPRLLMQQISGAPSSVVMQQLPPPRAMPWVAPSQDSENAVEDGSANHEDDSSMQSDGSDLQHEDGPAWDPAEEAGAQGRSWTVKAGEHFWSIAEQVLQDAWQRPPTPEEVEAYWQTLVAHNRQALADPDNPDLVFPGQVFAIPTPPEAASS